MLTLFVHVKESLLKMEQTGSLTYKFRCIFFFLAFNRVLTQMFMHQSQCKVQTGHITKYIFYTFLYSCCI